MKLSICTFIRDNNAGAFGLWESMATLTPLADEFIVWDMGSTDGTWETLQGMNNPKLKIEQHDFPINPVTNLIDAGSFAEIPNAMIPTCKNDLVMYYQADEIFHENLIKMLIERLKKPVTKGLSFWRYQLQTNFQEIKWFPHIVHRIDFKDRFVFVDDGMNSGRAYDAELLSNYGASWFLRWGSEYSRGRKEPIDDEGNPYIYGTKYKEIQEGKYPYEMPTNEMILDISSVGGFLNNIKRKAKMHAPLWRTSSESLSINGVQKNLDSWYDEEKKKEEWYREETLFDIPAIMYPLLGKLDYPVK